MNKIKLLPLFLIVLLSMPVNAEIWTNNKIDVEFERNGNFGEIYLINSPLGHEALRLDYGSSTIIRPDVYDWNEGRMLQIVFDDDVGGMLIDTETQKSIQIYSSFVDSYFFDIKEEYCIANTEIYLQSNCIYERALDWDAIVKRNFKILYDGLAKNENFRGGLDGGLPQKAQNDLVEAQQAWTMFREQQLSANTSIFDQQGTIYNYRHGVAYLTINKNRAVELSELITYAVY